MKDRRDSRSGDRGQSGLGRTLVEESSERAREAGICRHTQALGPLGRAPIMDMHRFERGKHLADPISARSAIPDRLLTGVPTSPR
jgi:hypothetical protein